MGSQSTYICVIESPGDDRLYRVTEVRAYNAEAAARRAFLELGADPELMIQVFETVGGARGFHMQLTVTAARDASRGRLFEGGPS